MNLQLDLHESHRSDEMKMHMCSKEWNYSKLQTATDNFSSENLLGEDRYGLVYKGTLKNGQLIAVKVQKEANTQGCSEFYSQLCILSLACHKNVVMLLGYCRRESINILVYEYICDRSLDWYLFGKQVICRRQKFCSNHLFFLFIFLSSSVTGCSMQIIQKMFLCGTRDVLLPLELQKGCVFCMMSVGEVLFSTGT